MPLVKIKACDIAEETKKKYIPYIKDKCKDKWPSTSFLCHSETMVAQPPSTKEKLHCRFAFYERDPVNLALDWVEPNAPIGIPVIMPANDTRPGGDWESSAMYPEECLCRRSNLLATLTTPGDGNHSQSNYPIPAKAGIYSENVVVFRDGPPKYDKWIEMRALPIISVCPVKRPRLDSSGQKYSFKQEKELMRQKIQTALRIAIYYGHTKLCIGTFGLGPGFHNPPEDVAMLWRDAFLRDPEFVGHFEDIVFAFDPADVPLAPKKSPANTSSASRYNVTADLEIFRHVFKPAVIHGAFKKSKIPPPETCSSSSSSSSSSSQDAMDTAPLTPKFLSSRPKAQIPSAEASTSSSSKDPKSKSSKHHKHSASASHHTSSRQLSHPPQMTTYTSPIQQNWNPGNYPMSPISYSTSSRAQLPSGRMSSSSSSSANQMFTPAPSSVSGQQRQQHASVNMYDYDEETSEESDS